MNVLAHIYLSGDSDKIIIGNYIGDYVKGRDYLKYPDLIRKGIIIHRHIDGFTDRHPVVHRSKIFFTRKYHKYAGVITDIIYDHFLTKEWDFFSAQTRQWLITPVVIATNPAEIGGNLAFRFSM